MPITPINGKTAINAMIAGRISAQSARNPTVTMHVRVAPTKRPNTASSMN